MMRWSLPELPLYVVTAVCASGHVAGWAVSSSETELRDFPQPLLFVEDTRRPLGEYLW
jgi:hypothetical protein